MKHKACPAQFKDYDSAGLIDAQAGEFEAIVSVFGNEDYGGDIVQPGAFADTIAAWKHSGNTLPILYSHRFDDPNYNIGSVIEIEEMAAGDSRLPSWVNGAVQSGGGLYVRARLDTGDEASPIAKQVGHLLRQRRVTQFSFAYDVLDSRPGTKDGTTDLTKLWLYEVGPTLIGMNPATELLTAKAPPGPDDPPTAPMKSTSRGGQTAASFRLRAQIAALAATAQSD
jgi:phage head maturation protease